MLERLKRRADFRQAAKGIRVGREAFTLQAFARADDSVARVGFTVTKKTGNAVVRNRIRRRLREACERQSDAFAPGTDYVIVARRPALAAPFDGLAEDLRAALDAARNKLDRRADKRV